MNAIIMLIERLLVWFALIFRNERQLALDTRRHERRLLRQDAHDDDAEFRAEMERRRLRPHLVLGRSGDTPYVLPLDQLRGTATHLVAQPGAGKSRWLVAILSQLARLIWTQDTSFAVVLVDAKGETVTLLMRALAEVLVALPDRDAERLAARIVCIRPFAGSHLVPLRLFEREASVDLLAQGRVTLETIERASGAAVGIRQAGAGTMGFSALIAAGISPVEWPFVMRDASAMRSIAERVDEPRLRAYFRSGDYERESRTTIWGLIARMEMILSIAPVRAMLLGGGAFSFARAFEPGMITLVGLDGAPAGAQGIAEALGALVTTRLAWAAFDTSHRARADGVLLGFDELASIAVPSVIEAVERILTTGRSFGLSFVSAAQFANQIAALDHLLAANVRRRVFGRSSVREIEGAASEWLPVTGVEAKPRRPGEPARPIEFMSEAEEVRAWTRRIARLPVRQFLVGDRTAGFRSRLVEAPEVEPPEWNALSPQAREQVARGGFGVPRDALLHQLHAVETAAADRVGAPPPRAANTDPELPDLATRRAARARRRDVP